MRYIFHYNGDLTNEHEEVEDGGLTYHEHLTEEDGKPCEADLESGYRGPDGKLRTEAYFDDGNELTVYADELEEIHDEE